MSKKLTSKKSVAKSPSSQELDHLENVLQLMKRYGVNVLDIEDDQGRIHLQVGVGSHVSHVGSTLSHASAAVAAPQAMPVQASVAPASAPTKTGALPSNQKEIKSPLVGTFYRSASPTTEPYCKEGQTIKKGQTLCIVEAMKLMNEIESEFNGKIISVLVENGQPVEFGESLFIIET